MRNKITIQVPQAVGKTEMMRNLIQYQMQAMKPGEGLLIIKPGGNTTITRNANQIENNRGLKTSL